MAVSDKLLAKIKTSLRISHDVLDDDLRDTITACLADLKVCGVTQPVDTDPLQTDPLILNAIKLYCRKEYTDDPGKAAVYQQRYDSLKSCLMMATDYREAVADE